jgi:hypothetical protein
MQLPFHVRNRAFDEAIQQLRDGRPGESGYGRRIALLLTIPTFDDPVARDIRRSASGALYVVRTVWQRALDAFSSKPAPRVVVSGPRPVAAALELLATRRPSLVSTRVDVDLDALDSLLESVASATIPCHVHQPDPPLDATVYEVTFGDELNETRYRWVGRTPERWAALGAFASGLIRLVDEPARAGAR